MSLADYKILYSGTTLAPGGGAVAVSQGPRTFADLEVESAKVVSTSTGDDYMEITVAASIDTPGMPFLPFARHDLYAPGGTTPVFTGWLMVPTRSANNTKHLQTFRLDGPMSQLGGLPYFENWNYAEDPTSFASALIGKPVARVILNGDGPGGGRIDVRSQIALLLTFAELQLPDGTLSFSVASLPPIPAVQPPEDEQVDMYCSDLIKRQLRWVPSVTAYWDYSTGTPRLLFSDHDPVSAAAVGNGVGAVLVPEGAAMATVPGDGGGIVIDVVGERVESFQSEACLDLLIRRVLIYYIGENEVAGTDSTGATRKLWATYGEDVSTADNASPRYLTVTVELQGAGGPRGADDQRITPPEPIPTPGLAATMHKPFKTLSHKLQWSVIDEDVDWVTVPGLAVGVRGAGDALLAGSRAIIQQITRDIGKGTTTYQAGPPAALGYHDLVSLARTFNRTRNASRSNGGGQTHKDYGFKKPDPPQSNFPPPGYRPPLPEITVEVLASGFLKEATVNAKIS